MRIHRNNADLMAHNHDIAIAAKLITVDHFAAFNGLDRRALGCSDVDTVMETRSTWTIAGIDRPAYRPQQWLNISFHRWRYACDWRRLGRGYRIHRELLGGAG